LNALNTAYMKIGDELASAREKLISTLAVARTGAPIYVDKIEAARLLGVSESTINRLLRDRMLTSIKVMNAVRIKRSEIENFNGTPEDYK